ncbi:MAG: Na/Pi cotransporter family protein [Chitinispirillaceae bacterium]|nr:Na/Pi cotransporter family protein [Chitinispirillaceae bacterium]
MNDIPLYSIIFLLCGIAFFLYGMQQGEKNLKRLGGARMRQIIGAITRNRLAGYATGFLTTLITQSSSATTVMLVGLASVQLMTVRQSLGVILGSDLATTITVQLFAFKVYLISPLLIAVGFLISFIRKSGPVSLAGKLILAIGFVFFGMQYMSEASGELRTYHLVGKMVHDSFSNPLTGLAAGMVLTAAIQSSAATLAIVIAMAHQFTFPDNTLPGPAHFLPIVLGANIGTCSTAFLAILQAEIEGVRVAWAHTVFKVIGTLAALPFLWLMKTLSVADGIPPAIQIAGLHTAFNVYISVLFLPLVPLVDRIVCRLVKPHRDTALPFQTMFLHEKVIAIPVLALSQASKEIARAAGLVLEMAEDGLDLIKRYEFTRRLRITDKDDEIDFLHQKIIAFLTGMGREELGSEESGRSSMLIMASTDIEHIGDIVSKNITGLAEKIDRSPVPLSTKGREEIVGFYASSIDLLRETIAAFSNDDHDMASSILCRKSSVESHFLSCVGHHMDRLYKHTSASLQTTAIHIDLLEEINRITHFTFRIADHVSKTR